MSGNVYQVDFKVGKLSYNYTMSMARGRCVATLFCDADGVSFIVATSEVMSQHEIAVWAKDAAEKDSLTRVKAITKERRKRKKNEDSSNVS